MFPILHHVTEPNPAPTLQSKIPAKFLDFFFHKRIYEADTDYICAMFHCFKTEI